MTREEAIEILNTYDMSEDNDDTEFKSAIALVIEALEQKPCDDAISRQAVLDVTWEEPSYTDALNVLTEVRDKVKALPSVNPQKPKSEWQQDHEILKAYSDGANDVLDEIKADIEQEYKVESERPYGQGLSRALEIIDRYKSEGGKE